MVFDRVIGFIDLFWFRIIRCVFMYSGRNSFSNEILNEMVVMVSKVFVVFSLGFLVMELSRFVSEW